MTGNRTPGVLAVAVCVMFAVAVAVAVFGAGSARASFGLLPGSGGFGMVASNQDGSPDGQAGSHPYAFTTSFAFNTTTNSQGETIADGSVKDIRVDLPQGLAGYPAATTKCLQSQLMMQDLGEGGVAEEGGSVCPLSSEVGMVKLDLGLVGEWFTPVFNMATSADKPAVFGFNFLGVGVYIDSGVRTGGDYGLTSSLRDVSAAFPLLSSSLTLWGVPADPSHDAQRCTLPGVTTGLCEGGSEFTSPHRSDIPVRPLLSLPTSCTLPQTARISADSWQAPGIFDSRSLELPVQEGCERLSFRPSVDAGPDTTVGGSPSGLDVDMRFPQDDSPSGLAEADLQKTVVALPAGMAVNPASANGLEACTPGQIGLDNANPVSCPAAAKIGTAEAVSPSTGAPLKGSVFVAQQGSNPFGSLLALYLVVEGEGVLIKLAGEVHLDPATGQVTTTFDGIPEQPVSDIKLRLFGGPGAALVTPAGCGTYTTTSKLTPYSTTTPTERSSLFQITSGPNGTGCGPQAFAPTFAAGTVNNQAGGFSPFSVTFSREDQDQGLGGLTVKTPPGLLGLLKSVQQCGEPQASQGTCGAGSLIGHATATAGVGPDPVSVTGQVFLTGPYNGGPYGLSVVVPAAVGPFNLGNVVVRSAIDIDPRTAQITVTSDPFPTILQGIPLQLRTVNVSIDRTGFMFNPTSCDPQSVAGSIASTQGATASVSSRFQAANCAGLPFKPVFTVSTQASTSKKNGASLDVKTSYPAGSANIRSVAVTLPKQLPSRLSTIQQACPQAVFNQNPAGCPAGSVIGTGTATTPVLANPLTGPAFLVSHGGAAFPDLVLILQGERVTVELVGSIDIKHGITSSTFANVPDAPISGFELRLPEGSHSGLAAVLPASARGNLCGSSLTMPTTITAQNGAQVRQTTKIKVTGCPAARKKPKARKKPAARKRRRRGRKG